MGWFAYGHPFLDDNVRTMLIIHSELCHWARFCIDSHRTQKNRLWNYEHPVLRQHILATNSSQHYETLFSDVLNGALDTKGMFMEMRRDVLHLAGYRQEVFVSQPLKLQGLPMPVL